MLVIVGTPIGNLKDVSTRAIETLKACELVLCEDTRISCRLLRTCGIQTPMLSFHKFNERAREELVIKALKEGKTIALISDAGMPGICDPGMGIVRRCREEGIEVRVVPGPCALTAALSLSGKKGRRFQFVGYLEKKEGALKEQLIDMLTYEGLSVAYETPHHLKKSLELLEKIAPKTEVFLARELTKLYEESLSGTPKMLLNHFQTKPLKGELVLIFSGVEQKRMGTPKEWIEELESVFQLSRKEAILLAAKGLKWPKRELYKASFSDSEGTS